LTTEKLDVFSSSTQRGRSRRRANTPAGKLVSGWRPLTGRNGFGSCVRQVLQIDYHGSLLGKSRRRRAASLKLAAPPVEPHAAIAIVVFMGLICSRSSSAFK
jgi:hypothetical protein